MSSEALPAPTAQRPGLRAAVCYRRPFERESLLGALAGLGVFVTEIEADQSAEAMHDVDLSILLARGRPDLELIRATATRPPILVVIVPTSAVVAECVAAGASFCISDEELLRSPRLALSMAARLARQRRMRDHDSGTSSHTVTIGPVLFSSQACSLTSRDSYLPLSRTERDVLLCLAADRGVPVRSEVLAGAAQIGVFPTSRYLGSVIGRLRRKLRQLGADAHVLATVHGVGYVLLAHEEPVPDGA